jgi:two-component sensor histidine kinase
MRSGTTAMPVDGRWRGWNRRRGLLTGLGYTTSVVLGLMIAWAVSMFAWGLPEVGVAEAARDAGFFFLTMMVHQLPTVPLLTIAVNLAPRTGVWRYVCLIAAGVTMWAFCTVFFYVLGDNPGLNAQYAYMVALIVAACAYRSSARTAASALMQQQIDVAAIDSDLKRARLDLLRTQIEPHFLFNTLATVRTLARIDRPAAAEMVSNLMRYLSEALPKLRQDESSLAEEMQLIEAYLRIHQIRMGARLSYQLLVPDYLGTERIPTMMLLTLVENAVKHGINPAVDGGFIRVSASREHAALVLKVADSGRGMAATEGHGTGLANIRRRLTMLYGDAAVLSLARRDSRGVEATVSIPMRRAS